MEDTQADVPVTAAEAVVDVKQTESGADVNAIRTIIPAGGNIELVITQSRQLPDGSWVLATDPNEKGVHHSDDCTLATENWIPSKGDKVAFSLSASGVVATLVK